MMIPAKSDDRRPSVNLERTRQQLQDLDQLLQQMLALPIDPSAPDDEQLPAAEAAPPAEAAPAAAGQRPVTFTIVASPATMPVPKQPVATEPVVALRVYAPPRLDTEHPAERPIVPPATDEPANEAEPRALDRAAKPEGPIDVETPRASTPAVPQSPATPATPTEPARIVPVTELPLTQATSSLGTSDKTPGVPAAAGPVATTAAEIRESPEIAPDVDIHKFDLTGPVQYDLTPDNGWETLGAAEPVAGPAPYRALVGANRTFDRFLRIFGPLGRPFLSPVGRNILGWTGIILLLTAAALALVGWLSWPISWELLK